MESCAEIFSQIMRKRVSIMRKKCQIMRKFLKLIKLFPRLFPTYEVHVKVFMTCLTFFSHLLTGISSFNAVFTLDFYAKNGSVFGC